MLKLLEGHTLRVNAVAISTDGSKIFSGSGDKSVRIWSMETGEVMTAMACVSRESVEYKSVWWLWLWLWLVGDEGT